MISASLSEYLQKVKTGDLNLVAMGIPVFARMSCKNNNTRECMYRVCYEGLQIIVPYMTKRVVKSKSLEMLKKLIMTRISPISEMDPSIVEQVEDLSPGCFVVKFELPDQVEECVILQKVVNSVSAMVGKEGIFSLQQRFLDQEERQ